MSSSGSSPVGGTYGTRGAAGASGDIRSRALGHLAGRGDGGGAGLIFLSNFPHPRKVWAL
jgi:hypothetical protein